MNRDPLRHNNVRVEGPASAQRTLVFIHGIGSDQSVWDAVAPAFVPDCRVVRLDNVGAVPENQDEFKSGSPGRAAGHRRGDREALLRLLAWRGQRRAAGGASAFIVRVRARLAQPPLATARQAAASRDGPGSRSSLSARQRPQRHGPLHPRRRQSIERGTPHRKIIQMEWARCATESAKAAIHQRLMMAGCVSTGLGQFADLHVRVALPRKSAAGCGVEFTDPARSCRQGTAALAPSRPCPR